VEIGARLKFYCRPKHIFTRLYSRSAQKNLITCGVLGALAPIYANYASIMAIIVSIYHSAGTPAKPDEFTRGNRSAENLQGLFGSPTIVQPTRSRISPIISTRAHRASIISPASSAIVFSRSPLVRGAAIERRIRELRVGSSSP
jgi:hypothetical protein